jgi:hypothetical protein
VRGCPGIAARRSIRSGGSGERSLPDELDALPLAPDDATGSVPATVLHNAPGRYRPITTAIAEALDGARETLDVVNPYVTDRRMIGRIEGRPLL